MKKWVLGVAEKADFVADSRHCGRAATPGSGLGGGWSLRCLSAGGSRVYRSRFWVGRTINPLAQVRAQVLMELGYSHKPARACGLIDGLHDAHVGWPSAPDGSGSRLVRMQSEK
jgi:hypothetical protein